MSNSLGETNATRSQPGGEMAPDRRRRSAIDPVALMQIKSLTLRAKAVVEGFATGLHRSPLRGFSVEFAEYRPYSIGDDPRKLDWKLLARTDRYYVKQFEDETNRRCYIANDKSLSMQYGSTGYTKAEYATTFAATLAYYLTLQRDAVGVMSCGTDDRQYIPPRRRTGHLQQLFGILELASQGTQSDLGASLSELAGLSQRRGLIVLVSDLLTEPESIYQPLGYLRGRGHDIVVVRILDPAEYALDLSASSMLRDMETGKEMYIDPAAARADYRLRFDKHEAQVLDICHRRNARLLTLFTDQPLETGLLEFVSGARSITAADAIAGRF